MPPPSQPTTRNRPAPNHLLAPVIPSGVTLNRSGYAPSRTSRRASTRPTSCSCRTEHTPLTGALGGTQVMGCLIASPFLKAFPGRPSVGRGGAALSGLLTSPGRRKVRASAREACLGFLPDQDENGAMVFLLNNLRRFSCIPVLIAVQLEKIIAYEPKQSVRGCSGRAVRLLHSGRVRDLGRWTGRNEEGADQAGRPQHGRARGCSVGQGGSGHPRGTRPTPPNCRLRTGVDPQPR